MAIQVDPIRRNLKFLLPHTKATSWNPGGLHITQFYNTLSLFFPAGERFFIQSVRNYRAQLDEPKLKEQISAFIGQEGFHTREHEDYNLALAEAGLPVEAMDKIVVDVLEAVKKLPKPLQLSATVALEHLTAVLGDTLLRDPDLLKGCDPNYAAIWQWHAIEETEHKAVCYDAYETVMGKGVNAYALRAAAFVTANAILWSLYIPFLVEMVRRSGGLTDVKGWAKLGNFLMGKPGILRRVIPEWLDFFRPGFHPWMHDNREHLQLAQELMQRVATFQPSADTTPPEKLRARLKANAA
jgi:predicted metal-dependent hydrolase